MNVQDPVRRTLLYEETVDIDFAADTIDLERLRRAFAQPFERAAHAVQTAGYEQDDAVIERYLLCRFGSDNPIKIPAASVADRERFLNHLVAAALPSARMQLALPEIHIVGVCVNAVLEQWD